MNNPYVIRNEEIFNDFADLQVIADINGANHISIQLRYGEGTDTTARLEGSLVYDPQVGEQDGDFVPIDDSGVELSDFGGQHVWTLSPVCFPWIKVRVDGRDLDPVPCQIQLFKRQ